MHCRVAITMVIYNLIYLSDTLLTFWCIDMYHENSNLLPKTVTFLKYNSVIPKNSSLVLVFCPLKNTIIHKTAILVPRNNNILHNTHVLCMITQNSYTYLHTTHILCMLTQNSNLVPKNSNLPQIQQPCTQKQ